MSIEAMKQALEALHKIERTVYHIESPPIESLEEQMRNIARKAITSLRQAIEQAEKPLTDEQVEKIIKDNMSLQMNLAGIRQDFAAAHNIKE